MSATGIYNQHDNNFYADATVQWTLQRTEINCSYSAIILICALLDHVYHNYLMQCVCAHALKLETREKETASHASPFCQFDAIIIL